MYLAKRQVSTIGEVLHLPIDYLVKIADYMQQQESKSDAAQKSRRR